VGLARGHGRFDTDAFDTDAFDTDALATSASPPATAVR
jgi:hypothetical protein